MAQTLQHKNTRLIVVLSGVVLGMFAFATLIMPPLYQAFCDWTGLNGKVDLTASEAPSGAEENPYLVSSTTKESQKALDTTTTTETAAAHQVQVQLVAKADASIPWKFKPVERSLQVIAGKASNINFEVTNITKEDMTGRAVPSVSPAQATPYLRKIECFCFQEQHLKAGETKLMPLQFYFTEDLPKEIQEVTLSYTLYNKENSDVSTN